jgi:hypothetical protein
VGGEVFLFILFAQCFLSQRQGLRCDANISVKRLGEEKLGTRCEVKNLNSVRALRDAIGMHLIHFFLFNLICLFIYLLVSLIQF